jgi:uncharacterized protein (DUF58 family)
MDTIDWNASAKLSSARASDEFIVRERYADEAPRVVIVADRRPAMSLFPPGLPWLSKSAAMATAAEIITESAVRARGLVGYLDYAQGEPFWRSPRSQREAQRLEDAHLVFPDFHAPENTLMLAFEHLGFMRGSLPPGTFVFVLSDFIAPTPVDVWLRAHEHRWDVVPVVIQDRTWEQSFPNVAGTSVPIVDAASGRLATLRLTEEEVQARRERNERRVRDLLDMFLSLGLDPILLSSSDVEDVYRAFVEWADQRRWFAGQEWRRGA